MNANANSSALHEATRLLREGQYSLANDWLDKAVADGECTLAQSLDLRARSNAQQGFALEAERLWREALALEPDNPDYQQGLDTLRSRHRRNWLTPIAIASSVVAIGLSMYVLLVALPDAAHELRAGHEKTASLLAGSEQRVQAQTARVAAALKDQADVLSATLASHGERLQSELAQAHSTQGEALRTALRTASRQQSETLATANATTQALLQQMQSDSSAIRTAIEALPAQFPELARDIAQRIVEQNDTQADAFVRDAATRDAQLQAILMTSVERALEEKFRELEVHSQQAGARLLTRLTDELGRSLADVGEAERAQLRAVSMGLEGLRIQLDALSSQLDQRPGDGF